MHTISKAVTIRKVTYTVQLSLVLLLCEFTQRRRAQSYATLPKG